MHAFVEWWCEHGGMIRVGPEAVAYGDPYVFSVGVKVTRSPKGPRATATGTHAPKEGILPEYIVAIRRLFRGLQIPLRMERKHKDRPDCEVCERKQV